MITQQVVLVLRNFAQTQMHSVERYGTAIGPFFFCFVLSCESKTRSCGCVRESNAETCREIENMMLTDFIFIFFLDSNKVEKPTSCKYIHCKIRWEDHIDEDTYGTDCKIAIPLWKRKKKHTSR
jgi:hypothetical protein